MHIEQTTDMRSLAQTRRWLNASSALRPELPADERARRINAYARQVEAHGHIIAWLPPAEPRAPPHRGRFAHGDIFRPHRNR